jgi:hypothetical protein
MIQLLSSAYLLTVQTDMEVQQKSQLVIQFS